jgi:hypothetical protein
MARCQDRSVDYLQSLGYDVVREPAADIWPLDLLYEEDGALMRWGNLPAYWTSSTIPPAIPAAVPAADINGSNSSELSASIGLSLLGGFLRGLGALNPNLQAAYNNSATLTFSFTGVQKVALDELAVAAWIAAGGPAATVASLPLFHAGDGSLYVITSVVQSASISVVAKDTRGAQVSVDAGALASGKLQISHSSENDGTVTYSGSTPLTFGFQSLELHIQNGRWTLGSTGTDVPLAAAVVPRRVLRPARLLRLSRDLR